MSKNIIFIALFSIIFSLVTGNTCDTADDYGIINSDTLLTGDFLSDGDDYWITFTTSCEFSNIILSTCGSYAENTESGLEYLDTILEVYYDSEDGNACDLFVPWSIDTGPPEGTEWWNDDPSEDSGLTCNTNQENFDGEENHAVLVIPSLEEQEEEIKIEPGTYYVRISGYPGHSIGEWNLYLSGTATISVIVQDENLELPHDPSDGAPGGYMDVNLDASQSICTEQISSYEWSEADIVYGPYSNPIETVSMEHGIHEISLLATDLTGIEYEENLIITITEPDSIPISNAGEDIVITVPHDGSMSTSGVTVVLSGELSFDPEGDELFYDWENIEGPDNVSLSNPQSISPTFNTSNPLGSNDKEYEFQLTTTDIYGESDVDSVHVTVISEQNTTPVASSPNLDITIRHDGDTLTFASESFILNAEDSFDPDGDDLVFYEWQTIQGGELQTISNIYFHEIDSISYSTIDSVLGQHEFKLIVRDPYDAIDDTTITVNVYPEPNEPPQIIFDPSQVVYFSCAADDSAGCSQLLSLNSYNATYDPDGDQFSSNWYDNEWNPVSSLQTLDQGTSTFTLVATDSYNTSDTLDFSIVITEPNATPSAVTFGMQDEYESTADLDAYSDSIDTRYLYGSAIDDNHVDSELGVLWSLISPDDLVTVLDSSSLTGSFITGDILNNDYPLSLNFILTIWDPFSCHSMNPNSFNDLNNNGEWDDGEEWDLICPIGDDPMTYGSAPLEVFVRNYNTPPITDSNDNGSLQTLLDSEPWIIQEDVDTLITFSYNNWADVGLFSDRDDCVFDAIDTCLVDNPYPADSFKVVITNGEHYHTGYYCDSTEIYYSTLIECQDYCDSCQADSDMLVLENNYFGDITVQLQIDDLNDINNLSDTLYLNMEVQPVNDSPEIISFDNGTLDSIGTVEDSSFILTLNDITFYDIENDLNGDGLCDEDECTNIELLLQESPNYTFSDEVVSLTENFFGDLEVGLLLTDGEDVSEPFFITIPVQGTNDIPNLIPGMETIYFNEDFDSIFLNLNTIFEDVDGDSLIFDSSDDENDSLIFYSEIVNNELLMISAENLFGSQTINFEVLDLDTVFYQSLIFSINPVNDPPVGIAGFVETPEDSSLYIIIEAEDVDSDSLIFQISSFPEHGTLGDIEQEDAFSARILYTPEPGYRCEDLFEFTADDLYDADDAPSVSDPVEISINVGECNYPPDISIGFDINVFEDNTIHFIDTDTPNSELPDNYYGLNNQSNFIIIDEDSTSSPFIELWEGNSYYIENGYCAYSTPSNDWEVDTTKTCGLIPYYKVCDVEWLEEETTYSDGSKYCACLGGETCTASQYYLDTLSIRPVQDFDSYFDITTIANDGDISYNLSDSSFTRVYLSPINDPPEIGIIGNQETNEGEPLHLTYAYALVEEDVDSVGFLIHDVDNISSEISLDLHLNDIYYQTQSNDSTLTVNLINPDYNVSSTQVTVILRDEEFLSDTAYFDLTVHQVDDPAVFQSIGVGENQGEPLSFLEDTGALDFVSDIRIYYTDADWDTLINDNPPDSIIAGEIFWNVSPIYGDDSNIQFYTSEDYPSDTGIDENNQLYYTQPIILEYVSPNWNGYDGLYFIDNETSDTLQLSVYVTQQNDIPDPFDVDSDPISTYNQNSYVWSVDESTICEDEELEQGSFDYNSNTCTISNFFKVFTYTCDESSITYESELLCQENCINGNCEKSYEDMYYRLPYRRVPSTELVEPDSLSLKWESAYDIDLDLDYSQDPENEMNLFYRIELVDEAIQRAYVIEDSISTPEARVLLDKSFFTYNTELNYFDSCGVFSRELMLSDTSHQYLDLTGNTQYSWRVAASNLWCDEQNLDPSSITLGENSKTDFYIDLSPPLGSINVLQNEVSPEFMNMYITFDESIDAWKSEIFITYNSETTSNLLFGNNINENGNIYGITELFPGTGVINIDVESWDAVGNGMITSMALTYEEIFSSIGKTIYSPSQSLHVKFDEGDIQNDASLLIKEKDFIVNQYSRSDMHRVSQIYNMSSIDMYIIDKVNVEIKIPELYNDYEHWKFRIFSVHDGLILDDITTWSKEGLVFGELSELTDLALYYDPEAEFEIPPGIDLVGNYPNPFNPSTNIFYFVQNDYDAVSIKILDLLGREIKVLYDGFNSTGYYEINWDGTNGSGVEIGSGIYFIDAHIGNKHSYKKIMKLK